MIINPSASRRFRHLVAHAVGWLGLVGMTAPLSAQVYTDAGAFYTAAAPTYVETFEAVSVPKDVPLSSFTQAGIEYLGLAGLPFPNVFVASPGYTNFGPGLVPTTSSILTANGDEFFLIGFDVPALAAGLEFFSNGLGPMAIVFLTGGDGPLDLSVLDAYYLDGPASRGFVGLVADADKPITAISFVSTRGGQINTGIDNLAVTPIPEPAGWALGLIGASALLGWIARRQSPRR